MTSNILPVDLLKQLLDQIEQATALIFFSAIKQVWLSFWPYIIGLLLFVFSGVALQIIMLRSGGHNTLPPWFNRLAGSIFYSIFFGIIFLIFYWIFGAKVIDELWFALFGALSFPITGLFLRAIGFWYY